MGRLVIQSFGLLAAASMLAGCAGGISQTTGEAAVQSVAGDVTIAPVWLETPARPAVITADPVLDGLLARAGQTPDIAAAQARLEEANALLRAARASLLPSLGASASATRSDGDLQPDATSTSSGLTVTIPIDLFGANGARAGAAGARADAARFELERTRLLSRRTAGQLYSAYRAARDQSALTTASLATANESLTLAQSRNRAGLESGLGVAQAASNRDAIAATLPALDQAATAARLGLEALLGAAPGSLAATLQADAVIPWPQLGAAAPTPAEWVLVRPDLRAAGARLAAAGLDARAAQRDRLPTVSLSLLASNVGGDALVTGNGTTVAGSILGTVFDFGRLRALADAAGARAKAEAAAYERAVSNALAEVETQAARVRRADETVRAQAATVASSRDQVLLARTRYTSGLTSFLDVLIAERALLEARSAETAAKAERADAAFAYAAALGL